MANEFIVKNGLILNGDGVINGRLTTEKLTITSGATNGYVLTSDSIGNTSWQVPFPQWSATTTNVSSSDITTIINSGGTIPILSAPPSGYTYDWNGVVKYNYGSTPYNNSGSGTWVIRQATDEMAYGFNLNGVSNDLLWHVYPGAGSASVFTQNYDQGLSIGIVGGPISAGDGDIVVKLTYRLIQI